MARRRYLMAYDIADPKRLRRICTLMENHGELLLYSVFLCDLTVAELAELESAMTEVMHLHEDSVVQINLEPLHANAAYLREAAAGRKGALCIRTSWGMPHPVEHGDGGCPGTGELLGAG